MDTLYAHIMRSVFAKTGVFVTCVTYNLKGSFHPEGVFKQKSKLAMGLLGFLAGNLL